MDHTEILKMVLHLLLKEDQTSTDRAVAILKTALMAVESKSL